MSGMIRHAEGPWEVENSKDGPKVVMKEGIGRAIADCSVSEWTMEEANANAALIAAAPQLLDALRLLLQADDMRCENIGTKVDQAMTRISAIDYANRVIAQATNPLVVNEVPKSPRPVPLAENQIHVVYHSELWGRMADGG